MFDHSLDTGVLCRSVTDVVTAQRCDKRRYKCSESFEVTLLFLCDFRSSLMRAACIQCALLDINQNRYTSADRCVGAKAVTASVLGRLKCSRANPLGQAKEIHRCVRCLCACVSSYRFAQYTFSSSWSLHATVEPALAIVKQVTASAQALLERSKTCLSSK